MTKKILIGVIALVVVLGAGMLYMMNRNRTLTPPQEEVWQSGANEFKVNYSAPSVRERLIFGPEEDGALQPFGQYWRLGGNESTEINFNGMRYINGNKLEGGSYKVYCYPGAETFTFCFAPADGAWGYSEPEKEDELFRVEIPVNRLDSSIEQLQITLESENGDSVLNMICEFSDYKLVVPFSN